jgi:predicted HicB family RNase H-like nuclease
MELKQIIIRIPNELKKEIQIKLIKGEVSLNTLVSDLLINWNNEN